MSSRSTSAIVARSRGRKVAAAIAFNWPSTVSQTRATVWTGNAFAHRFAVSTSANARVRNSPSGRAGESVPGAPGGSGSVIATDVIAQTKARAATSDQDALDPPAVRLGDVVGHPIGTEEVPRHLDHDVI